MSLFIYTANEELKTLITTQIKNHRWTDSGFDIPMLAQNIDLSERTHCFSLGIHVAATNSHFTYAEGCRVPSLLLPRSSIYNTRFRLCNSIGLIDAGYQGEVKAMVDNIHVEPEATMRIGNGSRIFQICQHNFLPFAHIILVDSLADMPRTRDTRGSGGFGSTNEDASVTPDKPLLPPDVEKRIQSHNKTIMDTIEREDVERHQLVTNELARYEAQRMDDLIRDETQRHERRMKELISLQAKRIVDLACRETERRDKINITRLPDVESFPTQMTLPYNFIDGEWTQAHPERDVVGLQTEEHSRT
jgi:dUTP pyrophosphatase